MQMVQMGDNPGKVSVLSVFANGKSWSHRYVPRLFYLIFLADQANEISTTPVIPFDQPLWWKSQIIVMN